jgi:protoporphyrinogen IX oxidase
MLAEIRAVPVEWRGMSFLLALHVMANLVWIGSITCVGWLLSAATKAGKDGSADPKAIADLARRIYRGIATPAFAVSFVFGLTQLALHFSYYMTAHWFHGKLTFALIVIALHHVIGAKSKRAASGGVQAGGSSAILTVALLSSAFATVVFAIEKTQLVP